MFASTAPSVPKLQGPAAVRVWQAHRAEVDRRLGPCFRRSEGRQRAAAYLDGLLSDTRRKNGWQLAETAGDATPYGFQHLLGRAVWSADAARDELYAYVTEHLGDSEAVVVIDQLGFPKKGEHSAGVARQYCGVLGQVANCQVGVFLAYAGARGHTLLDRELYLPEAWTDDGARLQTVGLAPDTPSATKPQLAQRMLARVLEAGLPVSWVTGDTVYGRAADLRRWLENRGMHHVLAVPRNESLWVGRDDWTPETVHAVHGDQAWHRLSTGAGSENERGYDWQCRMLTAPEDADGRHYLLLRHTAADPDAWQAYVAFAPQGCDPETLVAVADRRWSIEQTFEAARQEVGLDDYEVRSAVGWYRHVTLALWALALLAVVRAADLARPDPQERSSRTHSLAAFKRGRGLAGD